MDEHINVIPLAIGVGVSCSVLPCLVLMFFGRTLPGRLRRALLLGGQRALTSGVAS